MGVFSLSPVALFFALLIGHALCDYPLQGDFLARAKNHYADPNVWGGCPWWQALTAHAAIQAGAVWLLTGSSTLAAFEFVCHWCIDRTKSGGAISFDTDQLLHVLCKAAWVWLLVAAMVFP